MIRLLLGLLVPSRGRAEIFGLDTRRQTVAAHGDWRTYRRGQLWPSLSGPRRFVSGKRPRQVDLTYQAELIERFNSTRPNGSDALKGNRQKLILVAALMTRAELLILDEPTSGLDPLMEQAFRQCILRQGARSKCAALVAHIDEVEALCDRIAILRSGPRGDGHHGAVASSLGADVEATFEVDVPTSPRSRGLDDRSAGTNVALPSSRIDRTAARDARALRRARLLSTNLRSRTLLIALRRTLVEATHGPDEK